MIKGSLYFNIKKTFFTNVKLQNGLKSVLLFFSASAKRLVVRGSGSAACWMWASISRNYWWCHESGGVALELSGFPRNFAILDHPSPCHFPQKCFPKMNHRLTKMVAANSQRNVRPECGWDRIATATQQGAGSCFYPVTMVCRPELWPVDLCCSLSEQPGCN